MFIVFWPKLNFVAQIRACLKGMNKLLRLVVIFLIFKIDWRKLLPIGLFITVTGIVFQTCTLLYPVGRLNSPLSVTFPASYKPLNGSLSSISATSLIREEQTEPIPVASLNATIIQPVPVVRAGGKSRERRTHRKIIKSNISVTLQPPVLPSSSNRRPSHFQKKIWALTPDQALIYAKKEIDNVSDVTDDHDPDLYAPLFRNVSLFKRSYELMELILKVYIYQEGKRPIFHTPYLRGIYSSEGWFMKLMEENKRFVTKDPEKAHLFYLPYSVRQLQRALYVPDSHNMKPLSIFLRDYVNMIASKHPFWNRTHGSDHFLVACHDWGPYTLTLHEELTKNTIKALCNADTSEGIFVGGKDVSLPETTIRNPRRPLRNIGGKRVSQRPILAFFAGRMHGRVRPKLIKYWRERDEDMRISGTLSYKMSQIMSYPVHMKSSKYCICPMGFEVNSPRIVEAIYYECVPVIIADNFVPPLNEVFDWSAFSVIVAEKDIPNLKEILLAIPMRKYLTMQNNVKMLQKHFKWNATPVKYDMFHMILHSIWLSRLNQIQLPLSS